MPRDMSGSLSKNEKKTTEKHPDIKGSCMIGGKEYWIAGWSKTTDGRTWYSLSFTPKEQKPADDVPF